MLLERESALAALTEYAAQARRGEGRLALVSGEAGVGKSSLIEQIEGERTDLRWWWGACDGLFTPRPLGPLFDLAEQIGGELFELCRSSAPRDDLFAALLRYLTSANEACAVVIEDMHWADEASVDLLRFLGRRLRTAPVLLVATYRDDTLTARDPLRLALGELSSQRSTRRVSLAPLSAEAVATLAAGSGLDPAALHRLTGGNPFYVTEVLAGGRDELPPSARDAVLARAARLTSRARAVLDVAAITGGRVQLSLIRAATVYDHEAVDELYASGLLVADGADLRFRHEIARLAVEQAIAGHRRPELHAAVLAALRESGCDDDARLAFHAEAAGDVEAVRLFAPRAGRRAAELSSHREAAAQYERAIRFASDEDDEAMAALYDVLADELSYVDRWEDAAAAGEQALKLWREAGDRLHEGDGLRRQSRTMWRLCRRDDALACAELAVQILEPLGESSELAWAYASLANRHMGERRNELAGELAGRALELAERLDLPAVRSEATNTMAAAAALSDAPWLEDMRTALDIALRHGLDPQVGRAYSNLYGFLCGQRRFTEAQPYFVDGFAYSDERDMFTYTTCLEGELTSVWEKSGRWAESASLAAELLGRVASPINRLNPLTSLGTVRARRDEPSVWACLDEALAGAEGAGEPEWMVVVRLARAEAHWLGGDPAAALSEAETLADLADLLDSWERGATAVWLRRLGSDRSVIGPLARPYRLMVDGQHAAAADEWLALDCPYEAALALYDATEEESLRDALRRFEELGSEPAARLTRQRMRALRIRSVPTGGHATTRAHPAGLTRREHQVLDLICAGRTNAEIAAQLFISAKTVDHHVSAVLAKLGTPTRTAAASKAVQLGLA